MWVHAASHFCVLALTQQQCLNYATSQVRLFGLHVKPYNCEKKVLVN
jgi:hypothetical protein